MRILLSPGSLLLSSTDLSARLGLMNDDDNVLVACLGEFVVVYGTDLVVLTTGDFMDKIPGYLVSSMYALTTGFLFISSSVLSGSIFLD